MTKQYPTNQYLFAGDVPDFQSFFASFEGEKRMVNDIEIVSYGPKSTSSLTPTITFWGGSGDKLNVTWGLANEKGYLTLGHAFIWTGSYHCYQEGTFNGVNGNLCQGLMEFIGDGFRDKSTENGFYFWSQTDHKILSFQRDRTTTFKAEYSADREMITAKSQLISTINH